MFARQILHGAQYTLQRISLVRWMGGGHRRDIRRDGTDRWLAIGRGPMTIS